jgi:hypothetical protein
MGEVVGRVADDMTRRLWSAREGDARHQRMGRQRLAAGIAEASDDADHAGRNARLFDQLREFEQRGRAMLRRLDHHGVAGGERGSQLQRREEQLGVPGDDGGDHADRLAHGHHQHVRLVDRQGGALDLVGQAGEVVIELGDVFDLAAGLPQQLAGIDGFDFRHAIGVLGDEVAQPMDQLAPLGGSELSPRPVGHRAMGGAHGAVDVAGIGGREAGPDLAGGRIDAVEPRAVAGFDQRAIDQHAVGFGITHGVTAGGRIFGMAVQDQEMARKSVAIILYYSIISTLRRWGTAR